MFTYNLKASEWNEDKADYEWLSIAKDLTKEETIKRANNEALSKNGRCRLYMDELYTLDGITKVNRSNVGYSGWASTRNWV